MTPVSFDKVCRFCLASNGARAIYMFNGDVEKFKSLTEYEFSKILEKWMKDDKKKCEFCGSPFVEGTVIEIGNHKLYDFNKLATHCKETNGELFIWNVVKKGRSIELNVGGKSTHDPLFIKECFTKLFHLIDSLPETKLIHNRDMGDLFVCFTGDYEFETESFNPIIQRFWCTGLTHDEAVRCINAQLNNLGIQDLIRSI
ncbi:MAG TPA: hypothetical protein VF144_11875 [Chitinophagaceae bacterium]